MAGETTALAKPVMGTSVPAPPKRASLLYRFSPVSRAERNTSVQEVAVPAVQDQLAHHADGPAHYKGQDRILQQRRLGGLLLHILLVFLRRHIH